MSLLTIFHSGKFTVQIQGGTGPVSASGSRVPSWRPRRKTERDGDSSGAPQVVTHTFYGSGDCSNLSPLSMATGRGFSLSIIVTKHTHHSYGTLERSGLPGDAVAAAESGRGTPHTPLPRPQLPGCSAAGASGRSPCSR